MDWWKILIIIIIIAVVLAGMWVWLENKNDDNGEDIIDVTLCDLMNNPDEYQGKIVRVTGFIVKHSSQDKDWLLLDGPWPGNCLIGFYNYTFLDQELATLTGLVDGTYDVNDPNYPQQIVPLLTNVEIEYGE